MIKTLKLGPLQTNCYIFYDENSKEAIVIDPAYKDNEILDFISKNKLKVKFIYLTHCHFDHIGGVMWLKEELKLAVATYKEEEENLKDEEINMSKSFTGEIIKIVPDKLFFDNDEFTVGNYLFRVIHTPGHTSGSSSLYTDGNLFSGDTVFKNSFGRCDLPTGNLMEIRKSIDKLSNLPPNTVVYPGHGDTTIVGELSHLL